MRPFHDLRHTAITNDAAAGASPVAIMTKAGHANMATTKVYLHLAGDVFRDEANALEQRLRGVPSGNGEEDAALVAVERGTQAGTHVREPQSLRDDLPGSTTREQPISDPPSEKEFFSAEGDTAVPQVSLTPST
jgi:hypothetical protein